MTEERGKEYDDLVKLLGQKQLDESVLAEIIMQVKHPKAKKEELDLSSHLKEGHVKFGVISDTHLNSKYSRINDLLPTCYNFFKKNGAAFVVHCGDLTDGCLHRKRDVDEMRFIAYEDILAHVIKEYPHEKGMNTYFIGGNEDATFVTKQKKDNKKNICEDISRARSDMIYLGMTEADIKLAKKTKLNLLHPLPSMGSKKPYTISYPLQQIINKIEGGEKPDIMCVGYYHRIYHFNWRGVEGFLAGSMQNQTPTMRANQLGSIVGAWLLDVHADKKGAFDYIVPEFLPFYK